MEELPKIPLDPDLLKEYELKGARKRISLIKHKYENKRIAWKRRQLKPTNNT